MTQERIAAGTLTTEKMREQIAMTEWAIANASDADRTMLEVKLARAKVLYGYTLIIDVMAEIMEVSLSAKTGWRNAIADLAQAVNDFGFATTQMNEETRAKVDGLVREYRKGGPE